MVEGESHDGGTARPACGDLRTRRRALNFLLGASFLGWIAVALFPVLKYLKRPAEAGGEGRKSLSDDEKKKLLHDGFTIVRLGTDRVIVFEDAAKNIHALQAKCTHEGCTVTYKAADQLVWCACHNGKFGIDGRVISGPPPKPLAVYSVQGTLTSKLTIGRQGG